MALSKMALLYKGSYDDDTYDIHTHIRESNPKKDVRTFPGAKKEAVKASRSFVLKESAFSLCENFCACYFSVSTQQREACYLFMRYINGE